ncbi:dTDP-4-dehydrorhamnose reductase [soil metagenome]
MNRIVLVTGAGGQLGHDLVGAFDTAGWQVVACDRAQLDITDRDAVLGAISTLAPDAVVNAAAWTAVDDCEADPDRAFAVNALAVRHVADGCRRAGSHLCQISTDYVFDGTQPEPYTEWDEPAPASVYGRSKLAGEREGGPDATVVRTSWLCGAGGPAGSANMARTVLRLAADRDCPLAFVDDQRGCPTFTADLAAAVRALVVDRAPGVHHVTNQGATTWYHFARRVLALAGHDPARVQPIATTDLDPPRAAPRPANSVLDNAVLRLSGRPLLPPWEDGLGRLLDQLGARS